MLYRYRSLISLENEIDALKNGYLYAASFDKMNDPMEAIYELGSKNDTVINILFPSIPTVTNKIYSLYKEMINKYGLLCFTKSNINYPMWAYYANNFSGICLEFDELILMKGSLQGEKILPVVYSNEALPTISLAEILNTNTEQASITILSRLIRKRKEWRHEDEIRIVTGTIGKKYYFEDALKKVFLGPKIDPKYQKQICSIFENRPTEILIGKIDGYDLKFETIKSSQDLNISERIGQGSIDMEDALYYSKKEVISFIEISYESLKLLCKTLAEHPNMEKLYLINIEDNMLHFHIGYKTRGTPLAHTHLYYDKKLNLIKTR